MRQFRDLDGENCGDVVRGGHDEPESVNSYGHVDYPARGIAVGVGYFSCFDGFGDRMSPMMNYASQKASHQSVPTCLS